MAETDALEGTDAFFLKKVPQSTYRTSFYNKTKENQEARKLNVILKKIDSNNANLKACLRDKVQEINRVMLATLLPESLAEAVLEQNYMDIILKNCGLKKSKTDEISKRQPTENMIEKAWEPLSEPICNTIKIHILQRYLVQILSHFKVKIGYIVNRYTKHLPNYVAGSEVEDLKTIAQLEFLETLKVWNPETNEDVWPLAQARMIGAMKDHIRYITKSDPSRFYEWVTDAAYVFITLNERADFQENIETGVELGHAMKCLTYRERKIIIAHTKEDMTFKKIGERFGISESQISRIYKKAIARMRKEMEKEEP